MASSVYGNPFTPAPRLSLPWAGSLPDIASKEDSPLFPSEAWLRMARKWELLRDLLGGTLAMRAAGERWLPRETNEKLHSWRRRRDRTVLYGGLRRAVRRLVDKPFARAVGLSMASDPSEPALPVPAWMRAMERGVDPEGRTLSFFARAFFEDAVVYGLSHFLVDAAPTSGSGESFTADRFTLADERRLGLRPRFVPIDARRLFYSRVQDGRLTEIRWWSDDMERAPSRSYADARVVRVWVLREGFWSKFRVDPDNPKDVVLEAEGASPWGDRIPLVTFHTAQVAPMEADPPMEDLAWLNLAHWQSSSDQRTILHFSRVPILFRKGVSAEEVEHDVVVGAGHVESTTAEQADMKYVEHTGSAIGSGRRDLLDLKEEMEVLGVQPLVTRLGFVTATSRILDEGESESQIQVWIRGLELALREGFQLAAESRDERLPEDFSVDVWSEFGLAARAQWSAQVLLSALGQGAATVAEVRSELKRLGFFSEGLDLAAGLAELLLVREAAEQALGVGPGPFDQRTMPAGPKDRRPSPSRTPSNPVGSRAGDGGNQARAAGAS